LPYDKGNGSDKATDRIGDRLATGTSLKGVVFDADNLVDVLSADAGALSFDASFPARHLSSSADSRDHSSVGRSR